MTVMTSELFEHLLSQEEGPSLDFKRDQYKFEKGSGPDSKGILKSKSELLKDILAFANTIRTSPAYILIGVEEIRGGRSKVVGIKRHLDDARLHQFVNTKTQRRVEFSYSTFTVGGYQVGVIEIGQDQDRPIFLKKRFGKVKKEEVYVRDGSSTSVASPAEVTEMSAAFSMRQEYKNEISRVEFISQNRENVEIEDLFIFPNLVQESEFPYGKSETKLGSIDKLKGLKRALIIGGDNSGKTTLCRMLLLHLLEEGMPVMLVDMRSTGNVNDEKEFFRRKYENSFKGDYDLWIRKPNKTVILDDLSATNIGLLPIAKELFDDVFVSTSADNYIAYFVDDVRLAEFKRTKILQLKHWQQEELIRKWRGLDPNISSGKKLLMDGTVDQIEKDVNSVIINKIIPRYPFFVLSVLQTYEAFMPQGLRITAFGHCYYALIVAQLLKLGIASEDLDSCFNLLEWFAHALEQTSRAPNAIGIEDFERFKSQYREQFLVSQSVFNRLLDRNSPILSFAKGTVGFRSLYVYYFFLGRFLSENYADYRERISAMVEKSYLRDNSLTLIFLIHHASNQEILDDIILHTALVLDSQQPVNLDMDEVKVFQGLLKKLPNDIGSFGSVEEMRRAEREHRDELDESDIDVHEESGFEIINDIYKALKNMEVLSQILKNKYGSIGIEKVSYIVETVLETGLKVARLFLLDESEISELANFLREKNVEEKGSTDLREGVRFLVFVLVISCIAKSVTSIDKKELSRIVDSLCKEKSSPAYDLIHFLYSVDVADQFTEDLRDMVGLLFKKHRKNEFVERIVSWRVQQYFSTHREWEPTTHKISDTVKQSTLALITQQVKQT